MLKPRAEWPDPADTKEDVRARIEQALARIPGNAYEFTQPIQMRFNELLAGSARRRRGEGLRRRVRRAAPGGRQDRRRAARHRRRRRHPRRGGRKAPRCSASTSTVRRSPATASLSPTSKRSSPHRRRRTGSRPGLSRRSSLRRGRAPPGCVPRGSAALASLPVPLSHEDRRATTRLTARRRHPTRRPALLAAERAGDARRHRGPQPGQPRERQAPHRRPDQRARPRHRLVRRRSAQAESTPRSTLPPGSWLAWGGQFENLVRARGRLAVVVPICLPAIVCCSTAPSARSRRPRWCSPAFRWRSPAAS